jgi:muramoyltetrapeptide carboxypeptidase LdcA involved in peptidoglycan recycling
MPAQRVADLHAAFEDPGIRAIVCLIGGSTSDELLEGLDYQRIRRHPTIFCGYSEITILHSPFQTQARLVTFYGPAAITQWAEFPRPHDYTLTHFRRAVSQPKPIGPIAASPTWTDEILNWYQNLDLTRPRRMLPNPGHRWLRAGRAQGRLLAGCLPCLIQLRGSRFEFDYRGAVLAIETGESSDDFSQGEALDQVDAELGRLHEEGIFDAIQGLVVGRPFGYGDHDRERFWQIVQSHVAGFDFPVLGDVNVGHADPIATLPIGVQATLDSSADLFSIDEPGVAFPT